MIKFISSLTSKNMVIICAVMIFFLMASYNILHFNSDKVEFNTEVRPILNAKCTGCHGGVKKAGGISFIYRELALGKGESGKICIVPGDPDKSEFIARLTHHDKELRMPLGKEQLTEDEIDILRRWVRQGAEWQEHWAYVKPREQSIPDVSSSYVSNEIDNFIIGKREELGIDLNPSKEADKATLLRRVSLDLTGLPPTVQEFADFEKDNSTNAFEKQVDRLLSSPSYGERWAGMWLDLARYADSKGYEKDQIRNIWRYRDYVIKSFNSNKPYDLFVREQLAGDMMPDAIEEQIIATAFHRNTLCNDEGGTDDEEFRTAAVIDRINTTFDVFQGVTMGCVQCHSHPYDPIDHKDYYKFMAFLNNTEDRDHFDDIPNYIAVEDTPTTRIKELMAQIDKLNNYSSKNETYEQMKRRHAWPRIKAVHADKLVGATKDRVYIHVNQVGSYIVYKNIDFTNVYSVKIRASSEGGSMAELRLDSPEGKKIAQFEIPENFGEWFEYGDNIDVTKGKHDLYVVFKKNNKGFCKSSLDYLVFNFDNTTKGISSMNASNFIESKEVFKREKQTCCWKPGSWATYPAVNLSLTKNFEFKYEAANGFGIEFRAGDENGKLLATTEVFPTYGSFESKKVPLLTTAEGVSKVTIVFKKNSKGDCDGMMDWIDFIGGEKVTLSAEQLKWNQMAEPLKQELQKYLYTRGMPVMMELPETKKRVTRVFHRGNWMAKTDTVQPAPPAILNKMPANTPTNRLGMAMWLTSPENPLTARVAVNRFWEQLYGYGIVETLEDFGTQGMKPTHPELLDYLALKFQNEFKWDVKKLLKYMVMSNTYRQSSEVSEKHLKLDPRNRYLARAPRVRLSAEQIRDQALAVSGLLSKKMYGPSVMPYQPEGIWQTVYNGAKWETSKGEDKYRRMLYTFVRRSAPYPNMLTFDGPSREVCMVRRIRTNTPLQALVTLNDTTFTEASQALAKRMMTIKDTSVQKRIVEGFKLATLQAPNEKSVQSLTKLYLKAKEYYASNDEKAFKMSGDMNNGKLIAPYTLVANAILNTDQFITKE